MSYIRHLVPNGRKFIREVLIQKSQISHINISFYGYDADRDAVLGDVTQSVLSGPKSGYEILVKRYSLVLPDQSIVIEGGLEGVENGGIPAISFAYRKNRVVSPAFTQLESMFLRSYSQNEAG